VSDLLTAAKAVLAQFNAISRHQRDLLVEGQTLESASANWDTATLAQYIDFQLLIDAVARAEGGMWQPIATAPKDGTCVWLWNGFRRCLGWHAHYDDASTGWHRQSLIGEPLGRRDIDPETHWMLLPDPPAGVAGGE